MLLLDRGKISAAELARHFETSERTIYRDIESLGMAGVPIQALSGPGGGYSLAQRFTLSRTYLSPEEVLSLVGALASIGQAAHGGKLGQALDKIQAISPDPGPQAIPPALIVSPFPWGGSSGAGEGYELLRQAIEKRRVVSFSYSSMRGPSSERQVEPFSLALGGSVWYLHGFCRLRGQWRLFRLSRMSALKILPESYQAQKRLPAPGPWNSEWGCHSLQEIRLRLEPQLRLAALDYFGEEKLIQLNDGGFETSLRWPADESPIRFLLGFGPGIEVLEPESLRRDFSHAAQAIAAKNQTG